MSYNFLFSKNKSLLSTINSVAVSGLNRNVVFSIALAYVAAMRFQLPLQAVENPQAYFRITYNAKLESILSTINEILPFDIDACLRHTLNFFLMKNELLHGKTLPIIDTTCPMLSLFALPKFFSKQDIDAVNDNAETLIILLARCKVLIDAAYDACEQDVRIESDAKQHAIFDKE